MQDWLISIYLTHHYWVYAFIMLVGLMEGPFISMVCGAILALGYLSFWPVYIALMLGDLMGDIVWYFTGRRFGEKFIWRFGKYFNITERHVERVKNIFQVRKYLILFVSKISNGFGFAIAVLFAAGMTRIPFWQFMGINIFGQILWSATLIGLGFFFGDLYLKINSIAGKIGLVILAGVLIFTVWRYLKYLQKKVD